MTPTARSWWRRWLQQRMGSGRGRPHCRRAPGRPRLSLEVLEDRQLLNATIYTVTSTADDGSTGTLRDAINQVNAGSYNEIDFNIGTPGSSQTINLSSALPALTASNAFINGLSQGGRLIEINGANAGVGSDGLQVQGSNDAVTGLLIEGFLYDSSTNKGGNGILVQGSNDSIGGTTSGAGDVLSGNGASGLAIASSATGTLVQGSYIGTDASGSSAQRNGSNGILDDGSNTTIGGTTAGARNVISGNSRGVYLQGSSTLLEGNYIGTNAAGTSAVANSYGIFVFGHGNTIGGASAGGGNVLSGNTSYGVNIINTASGVLVQGNYIGTNATGTSALPNEHGISLSSNNNTIGGTAGPSTRNFISGNSRDGVLIYGGSGNVILGNFIGTNAAGTGALGNGISGINVSGSNNTIGGSSASTRNFISGNANDGILISGADNLVSASYIGTDNTGIAGLANRGNGIEVTGNGNTIGGLTLGARSFISGNSKDGVLISGSGNAVLGSYIGTTNTGTGALSNGTNGIEVTGKNNTIGGSSAGARNIISANTKDGVLISGSGNAVQGSFIGTNAAGTGALGNGSNGVELAGNSNTIGGTVAAARNFVSGNSKDGVLISGSGNQVLGSYIGTTNTGSAPLANSGNGIELTGNSNTIGGTVAGARNFISGNANDGVLISGSGNQVLGSYIGTTNTGSAPLANSGNGVEVQGVSNTIGGSIAGARNIISANTKDGVLISGNSNAVQGSFIGTNAAGTGALGNGGYGVNIAASSNTIGGSVAGTGNTIANNSAGGVQVSTGNGDTITHNAIYSNGSTGSGPGIVLAAGANNSLAAPVLSSAQLSGSTLTVSGTFTVPTGNVLYMLEVFANPTGDAEGKVLIGYVGIKPTKTGTYSFRFITTTSVTGTNPVITTTLTDGSGDTSAFSNGVPVS